MLINKLAHVQHTKLLHEWIKVTTQTGNQFPEQEQRRVIIATPRKMLRHLACPFFTGKKSMPMDGASVSIFDRSIVLKRGEKTATQYKRANDTIRIMFLYQATDSLGGKVLMPPVKIIQNTEPLHLSNLLDSVENCASGQEPVHSGRYSQLQP